MGNRVVEACWIGFGLVWLTASFSANKTAYRQSLAEKMRWLYDQPDGLPW